MSSGSEHATRALTTLAGGDAQGAETLMPLVYEELRQLAGQYMRGQSPSHTLQATALVHEAFIKLIGGKAAFADEAHFYAVAARAMRQVLVNAAESSRAQKRGGDRKRFTLDTGDLRDEVTETGIIEIHEHLARLESLDARKARVVEMRLFGGSTMEHIAHVLGVSLSTVESDWRMARAWLAAEMSKE